MSFYIQSLFIAVPSFIFLILLEEYFAKRRGIKVNNHEDMISSLSSGITNTTKDAFKLSIVIISYSWLVENISIYKIESIWLSVFIAFIVQDFTGYWMHRLCHTLKIFWIK